MKVASFAALCLLVVGCGARTVDPCAGVAVACISLQLQPSNTVHQLDSVSVHIVAPSIDVDKMVTLPSKGAFALPTALALDFDSFSAATPQLVQIAVTGTLKNVVQGGASVSTMLAAHQHVTLQAPIVASASLCSGCPAVANATTTCSGNPPTCGYKCNAGTHACSGKCVDDTSVDSCGTSCTPCPPPPTNGTATCDGMSCGYTCPSGQHACNGACVDAGATSSCGSRCTACPQPAYGTATCDGTSCGFTCMTGFAAVGTECLPCGAMGQPCCGGKCNPGFGCGSDNFCGSPWTLASASLGSDNIVGIWGSSATDVYVSGGQGTIYHSTSGLNGFTALTTLPNANLGAIWGSGPADIYIAGTQNGNPVIFHNAGGPSGSWTPQTPAGSVSVVWGSGPTDVFAGGTGFYHSTGGGAAFTAQTAPANAGAYAIWGSGPNDVYATQSSCYHYTVAGGWQTVTGPASSSLRAVGGTGPNDVYVGGLHFLAHYDGGAWTTITLPSSLQGVYFNAIWASGPNDVYAVGVNSGAVGHWDGTAWSAQLLPPNVGVAPNFYAIWGSGPDDVYVSAGTTLMHHP